MNAFSKKILKYIGKQDAPISEEALVNKFGVKTYPSLEYLKGLDYISEGESIKGMRYDRDTNTMEPYTVPNKLFEIKPAGMDFLQSNRRNSFDAWITRICAIIGALSGIAALIWEFVDHLSPG